MPALLALRGFVNCLVLVALAGRGADARAYRRPQRRRDGHGRADHVVLEGEVEDGADGEARARADERAEERALAARVAAVELHELDTLARERNLLLPVGEVDEEVVRGVEAAREAVAVLRADDDLLAGRESLDGRPVGGER